MKVTVLYYSHKGKTAFFAREIAMYLWSKGASVSLSAITDYDPARLKESDRLITGCWTCGWFVIGQHPHRKWKEASRALAGVLPAEHTLFFTTYKIRTGSLFAGMKRAMRIPRRTAVPRLQSKSGILTESDKKILDQFIGR